MVYFMGLVVGENYVWYLASLVTFKWFGQALAKRCGGRFKVITWGDNITHKLGTLFIGKAGSHCVMLLFCETLYVLLGTVKNFIGYLFSLYYCCFNCFISTEIGKVKSVI